MSEPETGTSRALVASVAWAVALTCAYFGFGGFAAEAIEGIDRASIPLLGVGASIAALSVALWATWRWARGLVDESGQPSPGRRRFLTGSAGLVGGSVAFGAAVLARIWGWALITGPALAPEVEKTAPTLRGEWKGARIRTTRAFGATGLRVSDIGLGTSQFRRASNPAALARAAFDRGVTYVDTSPDYAGTLSENALGEAMHGQRDQLVLATKFCSGEGHLRHGSSVDDYMASIEGSLKRMRTDYIDVALVHSCDNVNRLLDPSVHEAFDRLKQAGKVRFLGVSTHTPGLETVASAAVDSERFDMMMLAYHHGAWPEIPAIIDRAAARGMAIVAMKTLKGAKHHGLEGFRGEADAYSQAAFKWTLSNANVSCLVVSFTEMQHVDEYLYASGKAMTTADRRILQHYDQLTAGKHCFAHCGACLDSCPENLAIHDVLRHRMYFEDYGNHKEAMQLYAKLPKQADVCIGCAAPCAGACPHGVPIQERSIGAHEMLTLA